MVRDLAFLQTWSIPHFKQLNGIEQIDIKRNEKTQKLFFVYGLETGTCSKKAESGEIDNPVISEVVSTQTGEQFLLLHQQGEGGGATTIATL